MAIENECHAINNCGLYTTIRNKILRTIRTNDSSHNITSVSDVFTTDYYNNLAGSMAFYIEEINEKFLNYYSDSIEFQTSRGTCTIL